MLQSIIDMKKILLLIALCTVFLPAVARIIGNSIVVTVEPDHADWMYKEGEPVHFLVRVLRSGTPLPGTVIDFEAGPELYPDVRKTGVKLAQGTMKWTGKLAQPGFYRLKVTAHVEGKDYVGMCTAAYAPEKLRPYTHCPSDFDAFWKARLEQVRRVPLASTRRLLPERSNDKVNVYEVSFQNDRPGSRIYGILSVPTMPGKYPALIRMPGAGVRPYNGDMRTAEKGAITLEIGIHGISVTQNQGLYDDLYKGALANYWDTNIGSPTQNYFYRVVTGALRAVDYMASQPQWDGRTMGVTGASQGGFLTLATAALDSRVTFIAVVHDAMCDHEAYLHGVAGGWPHYFRRNANPLPGEIAGVRYYDGVNFARRVKCKGWYSLGFNDEVVPPTSSYSTYNVITAPKELSIYQQTGHFLYQEQSDEWDRWLYRQMGIGQ